MPWAISVIFTIVRATIPKPWNILRDDNANSIKLVSGFVDNSPKSLKIELSDDKKIEMSPLEVVELFDTLEAFIIEATAFTDPKVPEVKPLKRIRVNEKKLEHQWCVSRDDGSTMCFKK